MCNPNMEATVHELMELKRMKEELEAEIAAAEDAIKAVIRVVGGRGVTAGLLILNRVGTIRRIAIVAPILIRLGLNVVVGHSVLVALLQQLLQGVVASRNVADLQRGDERHLRERFICRLIDHQIGIDRGFGLGFLSQLRILQRVLVHI